MKENSLSKQKKKRAKLLAQKLYDILMQQDNAVFYEFFNLIYDDGICPLKDQCYCDFREDP